MKASYHNGRATKAGNVYNANHNTKIETRDKQKHIDHERTLENVVWARDINNLSSLFAGAAYFILPIPDKSD